MHNTKLLDHRLLFAGASSQREAEDWELLPANQPPASSASGRQHDKQPALQSPAPRKTESGDRRMVLLAMHPHGCQLRHSMHHSCRTVLRRVVLYVVAAQCHASAYLPCSICDCNKDQKSFSYIKRNKVLNLLRLGCIVLYAVSACCHALLAAILG